MDRVLAGGFCCGVAGGLAVDRSRAVAGDLHVTGSL